MKEDVSDVWSAIIFVMVTFLGTMASITAVEILIEIFMKAGGANIPSRSTEGVWIELLIALGITVVISVLAVINHFTKIRDKIEDFMNCRNNTGAFKEYKYAQGSIKMGYETFYTLFSENPEMYKIGHLNYLCIPRILYNSQWKVPVEGNYLSVVDYDAVWEDIVPLGCIQIRLSYKDQRELLKKLNGSRYDDRVIEQKREEQRLLIRSTRESLAALEMYRTIDGVVSKQNSENVEKAKKCLGILQEIR